VLEDSSRSLLDHHNDVTSSELSFLFLNST
jgi:hypothetical protein